MLTKPTRLCLIFSLLLPVYPQVVLFIAILLFDNFHSAKARVEAQSAEMTDRDAAFLATQRKKGGGQMMGAASQRNKVKYVSRVYRLQEMSQKMLTNYPQYLLACMYKFIYAADVLMPAMERLDEKQLNLVRVYSFTFSE